MNNLKKCNTTTAPVTNSLFLCLRDIVSLIAAIAASITDFNKNRFGCTTSHKTSGIVRTACRWGTLDKAFFEDFVHLSVWFLPQFIQIRLLQLKILANISPTILIYITHTILLLLLIYFQFFYSFVSISYIFTGWLEPFTSYVRIYDSFMTSYISGICLK